jgi:hypothetical protein
LLTQQIAIDNVIKEEFREYTELLDQKLVDLIYDCTKDTNTMSFNRCQQLIYRYGLNLLGVFSDLNKDVCMEIVVELCDILVDISEQVQNINTLLEGLTRKMRGHNIYGKFLLSQDTHVLIGLPIVRGKRRHFIKDLTQVVLDLLCYVDALLKQVDVSHPGVNRPVL